MACQLPVIPYPSVVEYCNQHETYTLPRVPGIQCDEANESLQQKARYLQSSLEQRFSTQTVICDPCSGQHVSGGACPAITLVVVEQLQQLDQFRWRQEGYELVCGPQGIKITALTPTGVFYGIQTLLQALQSAPEGLVLPYIRVRSIGCTSCKMACLCCVPTTRASTTSRRSMQQACTRRQEYHTHLQQCNQK